MSMMEIVDDPSLVLEVKQAALVQLKNNIKMRWLAKKEEIDPKEKEQIKGALLLAVIRCQQAHKLIKLYKEVFTIIIGHEYKTWFPINAIIERIQQEQDLVPLIHVLLAMAASFEFSITEEERTYFFEVTSIRFSFSRHASPPSSSLSASARTQNSFTCALSSCGRLCTTRSAR